MALRLADHVRGVLANDRVARVETASPARIPAAVESRAAVEHEPDLSIVNRQGAGGV
jgi:hypothetical protein